jgi:putative acetyltransferase
MRVERLSPVDYEAVADVWEASVRETHTFLPESDIQFFRPLILEKYLDAVDLRGVRDDKGDIAGFVGVSAGQVEMLFVLPKWMRCGIGTKLLSYAVTEMGARTVDVNEQNPGAVSFYKRFGFDVVGRSPVDGLGKPYPLLHMELRSEKP